MTAPLFPTSYEVQRSAVISPDGLYRYRLDRWWGPESEGMGSNRMPFMMLNPSTADADEDDRTIRRCIGFAHREGCNGITVVNIGAYRATDPDEWAAAGDRLSRCCHDAAAFRIGGGIRCQETLEIRDIALLGREEERLQQTSMLMLAE